MAFQNFFKMFKIRLSPAVIDISKQIKEVDFILGADMFFKKPIFDKIGGLDVEQLRKSKILYYKSAMETPWRQ